MWKYTWKIVFEDAFEIIENFNFKKCHLLNHNRSIFSKISFVQLDSRAYLARSCYKMWSLIISIFSSSGRWSELSTLIKIYNRLSQRGIQNFKMMFRIMYRPAKKKCCSGKVRDHCWIATNYLFWTQGDNSWVIRYESYNWIPGLNCTKTNTLPTLH